MSNEPNPEIQNKEMQGVANDVAGVLARSWASARALASQHEAAAIDTAFARLASDLERHFLDRAAFFKVFVPGAASEGDAHSPRVP